MFNPVKQEPDSLREEELLSDMKDDTESEIGPNASVSQVAMYHKRAYMIAVYHDPMLFNEILKR